MAWEWVGLIGGSAAVGTLAWTWRTGRSTHTEQRIKTAVAAVEASEKLLGYEPLFLEAARREVERAVLRSASIKRSWPECIAYVTIGLIAVCGGAAAAGAGAAILEPVGADGLHDTNYGSFQGWFVLSLGAVVVLFGFMPLLTGLFGRDIPRRARSLEDVKRDLYDTRLLPPPPVDPDSSSGAESATEKSDREMSDE